MKRRTKITCTLLTGVLLLGSCFAYAACAEKEPEEPEEVNLITDLSDKTYVNLYGRTYFNENVNGMAFVNSASGFEVRFRGTELWMSADCTGLWQSMFSIFLDGERDSNAHVITMNQNGTYDQIIVENLEEGEHTVKVLKRTMSNRDSTFVHNLSTDGIFLPAPEGPALKIEVYGDSITCGEGVRRPVTYDEATGKYEDSKIYNAETENVFESYAGIAADRLDAELRVFGRGGTALKYTNDMHSISENYLSCVVDQDQDESPYDYNSWRPDAVVIYLGTNDYSKGRAYPALGYTLDGLKIAFSEFIQNVIGNYYGKDIPIVLCSGMMVKSASRLDEVMLNVKNMLSQQFPNLDVLSFPENVVDPSAHPILPESVTAGENLAAKIRELLGISE